MIRQLYQSIREYKRDTFLTPVFVILEVFMEALIPYTIALLVNDIRAGAGIGVILSYAWKLLAMSLVSLAGGYIAGMTCSKASCGFAKNLRHDVFANIQGFSFTNIDRFSNASLVTRLTTDIQNIQMAFMQIIRGAIRAPLNLIFSFFMAYYMGGSMAVIFLFVIPFLAIALFAIIKITLPVFRKGFPMIDRLNASVEENVKGIRVVKSYVREDYEKEKFGKASNDIRRIFTKAERILAFNNPVMQMSMYVVMLFVLSVGSKHIIADGTLDIGQFSTLLTYSFQILSSLMMLSMIFVMMTFSEESAQRVCEVLREKSTLTSKENAITEVKDGSIDFDHVTFKYTKDADKAVLFDIDLHIKSGETIGIIGGTGSAKSSLVQLIPRLYDVSEGTVRVGNEDVRNIDLVTLREIGRAHV